MFGSSSTNHTHTFGQSSSSSFGQQVFSQTSNASDNSFTFKPFGSTPQTGGSAFGGTSAGALGSLHPYSPLASTLTLAAPSTPAFESSVLAFGVTSTPSLRRNSSSFGGFGSTLSQTSPSGSTFQPTQSASGSNLLSSSTPFVASRQPTFGATSTTVFGATSTPAFGVTSAPSLCSNSSSFGGSSGFAQKPAFGGVGSTPNQTSFSGITFQKPQLTFGSDLFSTSTPFVASSQPMFGVASTPASGATSTPAFGARSTPTFGSTSNLGFGSARTPAFGSTDSTCGTSSAPAFRSGGAFGASCTSVYGSKISCSFSGPFFSFGSTPAFGQSSSTFGSIPCGRRIPSPFGALGSQATPPTFGNFSFLQSSYPSQHGGSRVAGYTHTAEVDCFDNTCSAGKFTSISAMPVYKDKSHEELRWEDYQFGDMGGSKPVGRSGSGIGFGVPATYSNAFGASQTFGSTGLTFGVPSAPAFGSGGSFGNQARSPTFRNFSFRQSSFPGQHGGSRVAGYTDTAEVDCFNNKQSANKIVSISAMPVYRDKSHEELQWEDYQLGDTGGWKPAGQSAAGIGFEVPAQSNPLGVSPTFGQSSVSSFSSTTTSNPFASSVPAFGSSGFAASSTTAFGPTTFDSSLERHPGSSSPAFGTSTSPCTFCGSCWSGIGSSPSIIGSASVPQTTSTFSSVFNLGNTQSADVSPSEFTFRQTSPPFGQSTTPFFGQQSSFNAPSTGLEGNLFSNNPTSSLQPTSNQLGFETTLSYSLDSLIISIKCFKMQ